MTQRTDATVSFSYTVLTRYELRTTQMTKISDTYAAMIRANMEVARWEKSQGNVENARRYAAAARNISSRIWRDVERSGWL